MLMCASVCSCELLCVSHACSAQLPISLIVCQFSSTVVTEYRSRGSGVMAHTKEASLSDNSLMIAAMAYRVKYRKATVDGKIIKICVRVESMGVHKKNRGGNYPATVKCKSLCAKVLDAGF